MSDKKKFMKGLFTKKTTEQKIIEQLRKKKKQYDKLREEMKQMTKKLKLEGGKIVENKTPEQQIKPPQQPIPQAPTYPEAQQQTNPEQDIPSDWADEIPPLNEPQQPNQTNIENERLKQQLQIQQQQMEAYQMELQRRAQEQQLPPQQPVEIQVKIELNNGGELTIPLLQTEIEPFIQQLQQAIETNKVIMVGDKFVNGNNIVLFYIE